MQVPSVTPLLMMQWPPNPQNGCCCWFRPSVRDSLVMLDKARCISSSPAATQSVVASAEVLSVVDNRPSLVGFEAGLSAPIPRYHGPKRRPEWRSTGFMAPPNAGSFWLAGLPIVVAGVGLTAIAVVLASTML
jgi:hypothetical protein